jgi:hypothetical protein
MNAKIPKWIFILAAILCTFGFGLGVLGYINPQLAYGQLNKGANGNDIAMMIISARNIGMAVIIFIAIISKNPRLMGLVLIMRFITEVQDTIATIIGANEGFSSVLPSVIFLIVLMVLEIIAILKLNKIAY